MKDLKYHPKEFQLYFIDNKELFHVFNGVDDIRSGL